MSPEPEMELGDTAPPPEDDGVSDVESEPSLDNEAFLALPFFKHFVQLSSLPWSDQSRYEANLTPHNVDVDKCEVSMSPQYYGSQFGSALSTVRLSSHCPRRKQKREEDKTPYDDWLLLAEANHQLYVEPRIKEPFFVALKRTHTVQPNAQEWASSTGGALIPVARLVSCLLEAGCTTIRLKVYGQKLALEQEVHNGIVYPVPSGFEDEDHPQARYNEWDIGVTYEAPHIWLFSPHHTRGNKRLQLYSMITPGSQDFGSVEAHVRYQGRDIKVKIYPRLVHIIKSINSRLEGEPARKLVGIRRKGKAAQAMVEKLSKIPSAEMGGCRVELSIRAPSLAMAKDIAIRSPFLSIGNWLDPTDAVMQRYKLDGMVVTKEGLLSNANWVHHQAEQAGIFLGRDSNAATPLQVQIITDVLSALGWHGRGKAPMKSMMRSAWWRTTRQEEDKTPNSGTLEKLYGLFPTDSDQLRLVKILRTRGKAGYFPCRKAPEDPSHRYWSKAKAPPRWYCKTCHDNLPLGQAMRWIAQLVKDEWILPQQLGLQRLDGTGTLAHSEHEGEQKWRTSINKQMKTNRKKRKRRNKRTRTVKAGARATATTQRLK